MHISTSRRNFFVFTKILYLQPFREIIRDKIALRQQQRRQQQRRQQQRKRQRQRQQQQQGNALSGSGVQDEVQVEVRSKTPPYSPDDKWMQDATQSTKRAQSGHNSFGPFIRKKTTNEDNRNQQGFWRMDTMSRI